MEAVDKAVYVWSVGHNSSSYVEGKLRVFGNTQFTINNQQSTNNLEVQVVFIKVEFQKSYLLIFNFSIYIYSYVNIKIWCISFCKA